MAATHGFHREPGWTVDIKAEELQQELHKIKKQWRTWKRWWLAVIALLAVMGGLVLMLVPFQPEPLIPKPPIFQPTSQLTGWQIILEVLLMLLFLSFVTFFVWRLWWFWQARLFLLRHATNQQPQLDQISIAGLDEELFPKVLFVLIAQGLRQRIRIPSSELDINRTLEKVYGKEVGLRQYIAIVRLYLNIWC